MKPPTTLNMGAPGSGKSTSLATYIEAGLELFVLVTEPNGVDALVDAIRAKDPSMLRHLHWAYTPPLNASMKNIEELFTMAAAMSYAAITDLKGGLAKPPRPQMMGLLKNLQNFEDDATGKPFGDVFSWGDDRALVLDSLSGLNMLCIQTHVGLKPTMHMGEWGVSMNLEETLINKLTSDLQCFFTLNAHLDRGVAEVTQSYIITPSAIGAKLGPKLGRFFTEVVLSKRIKGNFVWSTSEVNADVKQHVLPISDNLPQDYRPIVRAYQDRKATIEKEIAHA